MTETIRIPLGPSGKPVAWTTVDLADYDRLIIHRWYLSGRGYAFRTTPDGKSTFMHREVLDFPDSEDVHHRNDDKLDNRRGNLEACTHAHNVQVGAATTIRLDVRDRICQLRLDGWSNKAIANELGINIWNVSRYASHLPKPPRLSPHPNLLWTKEKMVAFVRGFHAEHGRVPQHKDMDGKDGRPWFPTVYRRFASLREFIEAAGFEYIDGRSQRRAA